MSAQISDKLHFIVSSLSSPLQCPFIKPHLTCKNPQTLQQAYPFLETDQDLINFSTIQDFLGLNGDVFNLITLLDFLLQEFSQDLKFI